MPITDVADVAWDLSHLLDGKGEESLDGYLARADALAERLAEWRGRVATFQGSDLVAFMEEMAELEELAGRVQAYASLRFATATSDPARGALLQRVQERLTSVN